MAEKTDDPSATTLTERYRSVVEDTTDLVVCWTPDGLRTFCNAAYLRCFGLTLEEAIGTSFLPSLLGGDVGIVERKLAAFSPEHPVAADVHRVLRGDDTLGWQHWVDRAFFDEAGRIVELQSVGRDLTEWKEQVDALVESEARFRALCLHAPIGIFLDDAEGKGLFVNARYGEIAGIEPEQALEDGWSLRIHPADRERVMAEWRVALRNRTPITSRYRLVRPDGETRHVEGRTAPVHDDQGRLLGFVGTLLDVTEEFEARREVEQRLVFEELVARLTGEFIDVRWADRDALIDRTLRTVGEYSDVDRVGLFLFSEDGRSARLAHEYRVAGHTGPLESADHVGWRPIDELPMQWAWQRARRGERVSISSPEELPPDDEVDADYAEACRTRSLLHVPLRVEGRVLGALFVVRERSRGPWAPACADRLEILARIIASAESRHRAERELWQRHEFRRIVAELSADFLHANVDDDEDLFASGLKAVCEYAGTSRAGLYVLSVDATRARLAQMYETHDVIPEPRRRELEAWRPVTDTSMRWCWRETLAGRGVVVRDRSAMPPAARPDLAYLDERVGGRWNGALLLEPLTAGPCNLGCLFVLEDEHPMNWSDEFVEEMRVVAQLFAGVLQRRETERRFRRQHELLAHVSRVTTAGELAAGIAHEMNQPLYAILNCSKAIRNAVETGGERPDLELLADAAAEIGRSSERAGRMVRRLRDFVERAEPVRRPSSLARIVEESIELIAYELRRTGARVDVDVPDALPPVVVDEVQIEQVFVNLLANACQALREGGTDPAEITITARESRPGSDEGGEVTITVADNGPGFALGDEDPFAAFVTSKPEGMGIGLSICRKIVTAHGGHMSIDPHTASPGACLRFTLRTGDEVAATGDSTGDVDHESASTGVAP